jgi:hypothetical protein
MSATSTADDARVQRYANWIGVLAVFTGFTTTGTLTFLASVIGWHGPVVSAATMGIGQFAVALSGYPWVEDVRRRHNMPLVPFRTYIIRMAALALALFAFMSVAGTWSR